MQSPETRSGVVGVGEIADLIRARDWSVTPLGAAAVWSGEFLSIVNMITTMPVPALVYWGPNAILLYNEAARPILRTDHPGALGVSAREALPGSWHAMGPDAESVMNEGVPRRRTREQVPQQQSGQPAGQFHDTWLEFFFSPIFEQGRVAGVLMVGHPSNEEISNEPLAAGSGTRPVLRPDQPLERVLDVVPESVVIIDRNWRFSYLNTQARTLAATSGDLLGQVVWEAMPSIVFPNSPYLLHYQKAMYDGIHGEFVAAAPTDPKTIHHMTVHPMPDGILVLSRDVTEERRREKSLVLTEKLAAMGRMASSIAHEINNPLAAITNLLYLARHAEDKASAEPFLEFADQELKRVANIVNQTLRFHRQSAHPESVLSEDLFNTTLTIYGGRLRESNVQTEMRQRAERPVEVYEGDIRQVLNNVIGNAIDAMPKGGRLWLRSREGTDWKTGRKGILLTVADTGEGMDAETLSHIYDAFYTTKGTGGTGLGLWVSAEIMERHSGTIRMRSSRRVDHAGTVASIFIPFEGSKMPATADMPEKSSRAS